jgi:hypothetical protein
MDRLLWREIESGDGFHFLHFAAKKLFDDVPIAFSNHCITDELRSDTARWSEQHEYILRLDRVIVEPERCLAIMRFNHLVKQSALIKVRHYPNMLRYLSKKAKVRHIPEAVIYDGCASANYYHHFVDAVNRLHVLRHFALPIGVPFIVSRASYDSLYFQHLYRRSEYFRSIPWLVQEPNDWYYVSSAYRLQSFPFAEDPWRKTLALYNVRPCANPKKRVFLSRDPARATRCITNESEIRLLLEKHGFETIYAERLSLDEQIDLIRQTECLVAVHGAGLVQQVFMNHAKARIIEIVPEDYQMSMYFWLAYALGVRYYDRICGSKLNRLGNFSINVSDLQRAVLAMLSEDRVGRVYGVLNIP